MRDSEIQIVEEILGRLKPRACLEWGAGYSTTYFSRRLPAGGRWTAIEHDAEWVARVTASGIPDNVSIRLVAPNHAVWTDPHGDGSYADLRDYVECPEQLGLFDFILIDGRARRDCLVKALTLLREGGIVALHDANRPYYHEPFRLYPHQVLFRDHRAAGMGLWLGSRTADIASVLDVEKHATLSRFYAAASRYKVVRWLARH